MFTRKIYNTILLIAAFVTPIITNAQTPVELHISHKLSSNSFAFSQAAQNDLGNDFNVTRLEYYISKISIKHDGGMVTNVPNHYILANGSQNVTDALGSYSITSVESISFHIGIDTPVNHADPSLQPSGHPLAPKSPSMHWGWTAGYRFVAIEGMSGTSLAQTYEIHALGDQHYFETTVPATGVIKSGKLIIALNADYTQALKGINISSGLIAHGDGVDEAKLLGNFRDNVFSTGFPVSVSNVMTKNTTIKIYPNPSVDGVASILFDNVQEEAEITVTDVQGRVVLHKSKPAGMQNVQIKLQSPGLYFVKGQFPDGYQAIHKLLIQ
jgi:hypothetical protein